MPWQLLTYLAMGTVLVVATVSLLVIGMFFNLWFQAFLSGAPVSMLRVVRMRLRGVDPHVIVLNRIQAVKAGVEISTEQLESHHLAGGRVPLVVRGLIMARRAGLELDYDSACDMDLAGQDVCEAVQSSIRIAGLDTPAPSAVEERMI